MGGTGVVAVLKNGPGPIVLIRADMDGLPVTEATGLPFASKVRATTDEGVETGVMHACGHDTHMAGWIGTLRNLAAMKAQWHGTVVMIAQPAEERGMGAQGDARRRAVHALPQAAIRARLPRQRQPARRARSA